MLSKFFRDERDNLVPVAGAYGAGWKCPRYPTTDDGAALVEVLTSAHQVDAAKTDPRVTVCSLRQDPSPLPSNVTTALAAHGVTAGMSLSQALVTMAETEPIFEKAFSDA